MNKKLVLEIAYLDLTSKVSHGCAGSGCCESPRYGAVERSALTCVGIARTSKVQAHILDTSGIKVVPKRAHSYLGIIMDDCGDV